MGLRRNFFYIGFSLFLLLAATGCSTVPGAPGKPGTASYADSPSEFSSLIETSFRKAVAPVTSKNIEAYLGQVASRVFGPRREPFRIELVSTTNTDFTPSVWALPNGTIFFDLRVLRALKFENEIAAALAFAWDRSEGNEFRERISSEASKAQPNTTNIWSFSESEDHRAIEASVDRIYKSGYDPRGLVSFFDRLPKKNKMAEGESTIDSNKDKARRTLSFYAPLLNPIVRTEDFYQMRKRLEHL